MHWMREALAHGPTEQRMTVPATLKTIFAQETKAGAEGQWEVVSDALRDKQSKLAALMNASRDDVLAYMTFPHEHWAQTASRRLDRANREIMRRADVIGIFPNNDSIIRLVGALMLETNHEWGSRDATCRLKRSPASWWNASWGAKRPLKPRQVWTTSHSPREMTGLAPPHIMSRKHKCRNHARYIHSRSQ
jgi:transposase-like protein